MFSTIACYASKPVYSRFSDLRELPSLVPSYSKNATAYAVASELDQRIENLRNIIDGGSTETDSATNGKSLPFLKGSLFILTRK